MSQTYFDLIEFQAKLLYGTFEAKEKKTAFWGIPITIDNTIETYEVIYND